jgi:hypothetical protein
MGSIFATHSAHHGSGSGWSCGQVGRSSGHGRYGIGGCGYHYNCDCLNNDNDGERSAPRIMSGMLPIKWSAIFIGQ